MAIHVPEGYRIPQDDRALLAECAVDTFRSGGPGGQHQNVTDSGVRLRHRPTGVVVSSRTQRSQFMNRRTCLVRLRDRLERLLAPPPAPRRPSRPSRAADERRLADKSQRSRVKRLRRAPAADE